MWGGTKRMYQSVARDSYAIPSRPDQVEPLRQEPEAPLNNATSRADRATLRDCACASVQARVTAFLPRQERGESKRGID